VAVRVEGQADLAVTERRHHHPWCNPLGQEKRGAGVAQVVEGLLWLARFARQRVSTRLDAERQLLRGYSRGNMAELARPRLTRMAEPSYTDEVKPRGR
jgi:hypothetical protein